MIAVVMGPTIVRTGKNALFLSKTIDVIHENGSRSSGKGTSGSLSATLITKHFADDCSIRVIEMVVANGAPIARCNAHFDSSAEES